MDTAIKEDKSRRFAFSGEVARFLRLSSLESRLIVPYILLTLLLAIIGTFITTRLVTSSIRERFFNQLYEASRVASDGIVRRERVNLENLRLMAFTQGMASAVIAGDTATLETLLLPLALNNNVDIITVVSLDGHEIVTLGKDPKTSQYLRSEGRNLGSLLLINNVIQGVTDEQGDKFVQILDTHNGPALFTSGPVRDQANKLAGVLLIGTNLQTLLGEIKSQALADIILLDPAGKLLVTTLPEPDGGFAELEAGLQPTGGQAMEGNRFLSLYERSYQVYLAPLVARQQSLGWQGVALSNNYVVDTEITSRKLFSILFALGTAAVILIGFLLAQSIAKPILRLRSLSQSVAAGDFSQSLDIQREDEIGELAEAFDAMTMHLRDRTAEANRLYAESIKHNQELAEINTRLQATQQQLVQSAKLAAVGQLTAGIVHDVKNPLTVIQGMSELLEGDENLQSNVRQDLKVIRESAVKANRIVTDLLKFARQSTPEMERHDLRETVEAALRLTAYLSRKAHIQVSSYLPGEPVIVDYDPQQIEQVLINLITNALQATPNQGTLKVNLNEAGNNQVSITVEDSGSGISSENLTRIFDPFFTTKPEGLGTGLGLSVSYGIIACHHGSIDVESVVGKGSKFTILLPMSQEAYLPVEQQ